MFVQYLLTAVLGISARSLLLYNSKIQGWLEQRSEISTAVNSYRRLEECVYLWRAGQSPYEGDTCHEAPLLVVAHAYLSANFHPVYISACYILCDLLAAFLLSYVVVAFMEQTKESASKKDAEELLLKNEDTDKMSFGVFAIYMLSPFSISTCAALTSTCLANALLAMNLYLLAVRKQFFLCLVPLALAAYLQLYPALLVAAVCVYAIAQSRNKNVVNVISTVFSVLVVFVALCLALVYASFILMGEDKWNFLRETYGFVLSVPDLNPNVGLFWYFFTEMFEHFRIFFLCVFQLNALIYVIPLSLCLSDSPLLLYNLLLISISAFQPYPSVGSTSVFVSLLPIFAHLARYMRHVLLVSCTIACVTLLAPVMHYLWLYAGSANANFYFAATLVYNTAQIFLFTDMLYAHLRRKLHLREGLKPMINGKEAELVLE